MNSSMYRLITLTVAAASMLSCALAPPSEVGSARCGQVFFYLQCPQRPTFDLSFSISGMAFLNEDGGWVDVGLEKEVDSAEASTNQIRLHEFYLPPGKYRGVVWTISSAKVKKGEERFSLAVPEPDGRHQMDVEFSVSEGESQCLFADWDAERSVLERYMFKPTVTLRKQAMEIAETIVYVANTDSNCVTVIDRERDIVAATIAVGKAPVGIVASHDVSKVYVANSGSDGISVIDTATNRVVNTINNFGYSPYRLALSEDSLTLYSTNPGSDNVSVIDTISLTVTNRISVGKRPMFILADHDSRKIYVTNAASHDMSVIDIHTQSVEKTITVGLNPAGMVLHAGHLYVANSGANTLYVLDLPSCVVSKRISIGQGPALLLSGLQGYVYVSRADSNEIAFVYPSMGLVARDVSAGSLPSEMAIDRARRKLYVANSSSADVSVVDLPTYSTNRVIQVGKRPQGIVLIEE